MCLFGLLGFAGSHPLGDERAVGMHPGSDEIVEREGSELENKTGVLLTD